MKIKNKKIVFFGTSLFAEIILKELKRRDTLPTLIITAPPKKRGRGMEKKENEVLSFARANNIDFLTPEKIDNEFLSDLKNTEWDLFIVTSYGKILPGELLKIPEKGALNIHPSMLPKLRGATPLQSIILKDEPKNAGISIIKMDEEVDHGEIVAQDKIHLEDWPITRGELLKISAQEGGKLLAEILPLWFSDKITPEAQKHKEATFTQKTTKSDAEIDFGENPYKNFLKIKAFSPTPLAYFFTEKRDKIIRVKITDAEYKNKYDELFIKKVIPEGKPEMKYTDFL